MDDYAAEQKSTEDTLAIKNGKFFAAIGYVGFLCAVPLVFKKDNAFALFHGKQALILFFLEMAACIISVIPLLGKFTGAVMLVAMGIVSLVGIYQVFTETYWRIPYICDVAEQLKL